MAKVYVVQDSGHNYSDALRFGEIILLNDEDCPTKEYKAQYEVVIENKEKLKDFDPHQDKLLLIGDPILIGICFSIVAAKNREISILKWDRRQNLYKPVTIYL